MWRWLWGWSMTPAASTFISISPLKVLMWQSQQWRYLRGGPSSGSCPKRYERQRSGNWLWCASTTYQRHTLTCHHLWPTCHHWPKSVTPRPLTWWWKQLPDWWFRSMSWSITWVWCKILPRRWLQKRDWAGWRRFYSPEQHLLHGNHGLDPPSF